MNQRQKASHKAFRLGPIHAMNRLGSSNIRTSLEVIYLASALAEHVRNMLTRCVPLGTSTRVPEGDNAAAADIKWSPLLRQPLTGWTRRYAHATTRYCCRV